VPDLQLVKFQLDRKRSAGIRWEYCKHMGQCTQSSQDGNGDLACNRGVPVPAADKLSMMRTGYKNQLIPKTTRANVRPGAKPDSEQASEPFDDDVAGADA
jgi:hypothetical protein